ncbi:hypothetical protein VNO77_33975 [Canavalia gladiata]|uniref:Uncharacterized protein n=1 Tax=Canavalia gladiata TaxID=3824 RepID=A0AAN9KFC4_CANGL
MVLLSIHLDFLHCILLDHNLVSLEVLRRHQPCPSSLWLQLYPTPKSLLLSLMPSILPPPSFSPHFEDEHDRPFTSINAKTFPRSHQLHCFILTASTSTSSSPPAGPMGTAHSQLTFTLY